MKSYSAAVYTLALLGGAAASSVSACATGGDTPPTTPGFVSTSTSGGGGSSGSDLDATTSSSSGSSSGSTGSSSGYGDDATNPPPSDDAPTSTGDDAGDDGSGNLPPGPTCTPGQACVDGIPGGWSGFVQLLVQAGDAGAGCAAPYDTVQPSLGGQTNPDGGPATCGTCDCLLPDAGLGCTVAVEGDNTGCNPVLGPPPETTVSVGSCTKVMTNFGSGANGHVAAPMGGSGTCVAQGGAVTAPPPPPSAATAVACAQGDAGTAPEGGTSMTCASGQSCATFPTGADGGMPSGVCVYQAGIQTCPPSGTTLFTNTFVVGAVEDSRGCGCACGAPQCPADGYVQGFTNNGCTGTPSYTFDAGQACIASIMNNRPTYVEYHLSRSGSPGTCGTPTGGPTGAVDIDGGSATTFCCIP